MENFLLLLIIFMCHLKIRLSPQPWIVRILPNKLEISLMLHPLLEDKLVLYSWLLFTYPFRVN